MQAQVTAPHSEDRIEEAAREIATLSDVYFTAETWAKFRPALQRLYDDGKKVGAEERDCAVCKARGEYGG